MADDIQIKSDGSLYVNGTLVTSKTIDHDLSAVFHFFTSKTSKFNLKNLEKAGLWAAALVATTNGFDAFKLPTNIREWLLGASGLVLAAIHNNTPDT